uniref:Uncharacterized protein n=1 Tax=Oryza glumipatula TaxID=40148 RepID=A0A0D9ZWH9_9ORYZ
MAAGGFGISNGDADGRPEVVVMRAIRRGGNDGGAVRPATSSNNLDNSPLVAALVWGRGDPFFSLALSLGNPTAWKDWEHGQVSSSCLMAGRRRSAGAVATHRRCAVGGGH